MGRDACNLLKAGRMGPESAKDAENLLADFVEKFIGSLNPPGPNLLTVTLPYP
jgi:hypothetical protein